MIVRLTAAPSRPRLTRRGLRSHGGASPPRQSTARGALSARRAFLWPSLKSDSRGLRRCKKTQRQGAALTREQHVAIDLVLLELFHDSGPFLPALRRGPSLHFVHLPVAHRGLVCRLGGAGFGRQRRESLSSGLRLDLHRPRRLRCSDGHGRPRRLHAVLLAQTPHHRAHILVVSSAGFAEGRRLPILVLRAMATVPVLLRDARREVVGVAAAASGSVLELDLCPAQSLHAAPYGPAIRGGLGLPRPVARQHRAPVHRALSKKIP